MKSKGAIFLIALLAVTVCFHTPLLLYVKATAEAAEAAEEPSVQNSETAYLAHKSIDRSLPQTRSHVSRAKDSSCQGRMCTLDLSMIDLSAKELSFEVGPTGISTIDQSAIEAAATAGLDVTRFKTFRRSGNSMKKGHWSGESGFSYLNLLQQGTGPSGTNLWFGTMYDGENDVFYDISPDATGTSIIAYATRGSERPKF